jgi:signal transduction histidine kinase
VRVRTLYGQLMATTSIVLAAVLVLSFAAYFLVNVLHAHDDTRHRMLYELPQVVSAIRHDGAAGAAPVVHEAARILKGGVTVYSGTGKVLVHAGSPPPKAYLQKVLADPDLALERATWHEVHEHGKDILVGLYPSYVSNGQYALVALNGLVAPSPPSWSQVAPVLVAELLALLLAQLLWSLVIRRFTRPLEAISNWAGRLAAGDLRARVETTEGVAELRDLGDALHRMADALAAEHDRREEFLAEVAHDLRTPLSVQRTVLMALARSDGSTAAADVPRLARQAQAETERLIRLVNGLLDLARLESGQVVTACDSLDLREPVAMAASTFEVYARQRRIALAVDLGADSVPALGDADRVTQIATNLIDNAVRHAGRGGRVAIQTRLCEDGRRAELSVTDSGPGVPEAVRRTMWQRFAPGGDGVRMRTGLGLAISRALARAMGGDLDLAAGPETRFVLSLPTAPRPA